MSAPKLITPLLDEYLVGELISSHHGVCCCPAIRKGTEDRYILKIITFPASPVQLEALLLSGAYPSRESALNYFGELAQSAADEAALLQKLARLEGFTAFEGWQIVPLENAGCQLYLLGNYRPTLARSMKQQPMTHLGAVNLGIDLCHALSICRRAGYLYVDLKPENIYISNNGEFSIGDLGFTDLAALKYASLPERYRSVYTAPEVTDAYSTLNDTLDTYAVGLILYQVYNNGELPPATAPGEMIPPPAYADYEMAEIILKACAASPEDRWADPSQMGQALVSYMQRNSVNDVPIIPPVISEEPVEEFLPEEPVEELLPDELSENEEGSDVEEVPAEEPTIQEPAAAELSDEAFSEEDTLAEEDPASEDPQSAEPATDEPALIPTDEQDAATDDKVPDPDMEVPDEDIDDALEELPIPDETVPDEETSEGLEDTQMSEEVTEMLAQADELIAHPAPDPVVAPEPVDVPVPELLFQELDNPADLPAEEVQIDTEASADESDEAELEEDLELLSSGNSADFPQDEESQKTQKERKKRGGLIALLIIIPLLILLALGAYHFYESVYLQPLMGITWQGRDGELTVNLNTDIDNDLLTIYCTDTYGNKLQQKPADNTVTFQGLNPGSHYRITVEISGFHKLVGQTSFDYTTATQTTIVTFTAITGDQDGSVILNFSVQGPENTTWKVRYAPKGGAAKTVDCVGHMTTITGLEPGTEYTFRLVPEADLYVVGNDTLQYTASKVILAENLTVGGFVDGALEATWTVPEGANVDSWTVRCYNSAGFDTTLTVTEPMVSIEGLDPTQGYTIEVKAAGMTVSNRVSISPNSLTFRDLRLDNSVPGQLTVTWDYEGTAPNGGWMLFYTINGGEPNVVHCDTNTCVIKPLLPGGHYTISFQLPDDITVIGGTAEYDVPQATDFAAFGITKDDLFFRMLPTPTNANWKWSNLNERDFRNEFTAGEKASFILVMDKKPENTTQDVQSLFVVLDANGKLISINAGRTRTWGYMWSHFQSGDGSYGSELDMPSMPQTPGDYVVQIYLNGAYVTSQNFTVK